MSESAIPHTTLYDQDFVGWLQEAVALLRQERYSEVDWPHLLEEIEGIASAERRALRKGFTKRLKLVMRCVCLRDPSPLRVVTFARLQLEGCLKDSPSLRDSLAGIIPLLYLRYRRKLSWYMDLLPVECPWTVEQILGDTLPSLVQEPLHDNQ